MPRWAGLLLGLSILARETALYFLPVARGLARLSAAGAGASSAGSFLSRRRSPWSRRGPTATGAAFDAFVPVSTAGGQNLFQGNTRIPRDDTYVMVDAVEGRIEQYRYARAMGLAAIRPAPADVDLREARPSRCRCSGKRRAWPSST